jgi:integrase
MKKSIHQVLATGRQNSVSSNIFSCKGARFKRIPSRSNKVTTDSSFNPRCSSDLSRWQGFAAGGGVPSANGPNPSSPSVMRSVRPAHRIKMIRLQTGERFPLVLDGSERPLIETAYFLLSKRRNAVSTLDHKARVIAKVRDFLDSRSIEMRGRVATKRTLNSREILDLRTHLRTVGERTRSIRMRASTDGPERPRWGVVEPSVQSQRLYCAAEYLRWAAENAVSELELDNASYARISAEIDRMTAAVAEAAGTSPPADLTALTREQSMLLIEAVAPSSTSNPFPPNLQFRNFALIVAYLETGLRKSEVLALRCEDISAPPLPPSFTLVMRPDDLLDSRARPASVKTMPRTVPVTQTVHGVLWDYMTVHRPAVKNTLRAKGQLDLVKRFQDNPFVFVSATGAPLSASSVQKIFETIRTHVAELPVDLSPHVLRRTRNNLLRARACEAGLIDRDGELREFLMGWVRGSKQTHRYAAREIQDEAARALQALQDELTERLRISRARCK